MKVLVYAATGSQMRPLVDELLARGHAPRVLSRRSAAAAGFAADVEVVHGDLDDAASLDSASRGVDAVAFMLPAFLAHPARRLEYARRAADAAARAGVQRLVWNTAARYPLAHEGGDLGRRLVATHEQLAAAGVPLTVIAPTTYMENLLGPWTRGAVAQGELRYPILATRRMGWIASRDVCAFVASALERPQHAGRVFRVSGPEALTGTETAAEFAAALGHPVRFRTLTPDEMKHALEAAFGPGSGDAVAGEYARDQADPDPPPKHYDMRDVVAALPVGQTRLRDWVVANRAAFGAD